MSDPRPEPSGTTVSAPQGTTSWIVVWDTMVRLQDGSLSAATRYDNERKARDAAAARPRSVVAVIALPLGSGLGPAAAGEGRVGPEDGWRR